MKIRNLDHKDHWQTPPEYYADLDRKFHFDFDPCPLHNDFSKWDALKGEWGNCNFVNPPYSQRAKDAIVKRAVSFKDQCLSVFILPVSTSTILYHSYIEPYAIRIKMLEKRLPFIGINSKGQKVNYHLIETITKETIIFDGKEIPLHVKNSGQHDSMLVII
jgi:site-specific DNA-methyltransferase (adenine-specific)